MRWATWDMGVRSPDHDILTFIHAAHFAGAEGVWFRPGFNYTIDTPNKANLETYVNAQVESERQRTILFDACELYGMPYGTGMDLPEDVAYNGSARPGLINDFPRFLEKRIPAYARKRAEERLAGRKVVVSIRNARYNTVRNSSPDWYRWAEDNKALVVKDYCDEKIPLVERAAIYEAAELHMGVMQGPMVLSWLSKKPYLILKMLAKCKVATPEYYEKKFKMEVGKQFKTANRQRMVWGYEDDYETIEREYRAFCEIR